MGKQLLEFQRVLICVYVCARSSEPPTATQAPPTIHPPASTLLLINLGAHPLRRGGYRQNFVFLLFFLRLCAFVPFLLFSVFVAAISCIGFGLPQLDVDVAVDMGMVYGYRLGPGPQALSISASRWPVRLSPFAWRRDGWSPPPTAP